MLEIFMVANIATKFGAFMHGMLLKLFHSFPNGDTIFFLVALMREFAKIDTILQNFVDMCQEIASCLTIWATDIITILLSLLSTSISLFQLNLALLAEKFVAIFAF
jgi:hypothetical protein